MKKFLVIPLLTLSLSCFPFQSVYASTLLEEAEARKSMPIESNEIENWPAGPAIGAQGAILMDINTGTILYEKNAHEALYPASITKILTSYIASEKCSLDERVVMSEEAVHSINFWEDANIGIKPGDEISMEEALYAVMVGSANEVAYAVGEHISGSNEEFSKLMNETAKELGCVDSNFINPNGIHSEDHYTSAHDMARIASAYFQNEFNCKISSTPNYTIPQSPTQPSDSMYIRSKNKLFPYGAYEYEFLVGSKTGYTDQSRQTLVTCAKQNGMTLVAVIMREEMPYHYEDTLALFQYGFSNFTAYNVASTDTTYSVDNPDFFEDVSLLEFDPDAYIVLPNTATFADTTSNLVYDDATADNSLATVEYSYHGVPVGSASIELTYDLDPTVSYFDTSDYAVVNASSSALVDSTEDSSIIVLNVKNIILAILVIAVLLIILFFIKEKVQSYSFNNPFKRRSRRNYSMPKRRTKKPRTRRRRRTSLSSHFTRFYD